MSYFNAYTNSGCFRVNQNVKNKGYKSFDYLIKQMVILKLLLLPPTSSVKSLKMYC